MHQDEIFMNVEPEVKLKREKHLDNGLYVPGKVKNTRFMFTADTGAPKTIILNDLRI